VQSYSLRKANNLMFSRVQGGGVLEHSDGFVVFVFLVVFTIATITQCFMFSVFFSRANLAAACAAIFYYIGYLPYAFVVQWEEYMHSWHKALAVRKQN
jgi:ATP-binding cassette, subfamily A (ABC1), member 4